jgi:hypothetical protein
VELLRRPVLRRRRSPPAGAPPRTEEPQVMRLAIWQVADFFVVAVGIVLALITFTLMGALECIAAGANVTDTELLRARADRRTSKERKRTQR